MSTTPNVNVGSLELDIENTKYDPFRHAEEIATRSGRVVVPANPLEIQLDIDSRQAYSDHWAALNKWKNGNGSELLISTGFFPNPWSYSNNKTAGHLVLCSATEDHVHVYLGLRTPLCQGDRICLQFTLGSDPSRESLNTKRWLTTSDAGILMFETPGNGSLIEQWRKDTQTVREKLK